MGKYTLKKEIFTIRFHVLYVLNIGFYDWISVL